MVGAPATCLSQEVTFQTVAKNGKATTKKDPGSLTLWRLHTGRELPISGHYTKEVQTFLFPPSFWISLLYAAKPNPNMYSEEVTETFQEKFSFFLSVY